MSRRRESNASLAVGKSVNVPSKSSVQYYTGWKDPPAPQRVAVDFASSRSLPHLARLSALSLSSLLSTPSQTDSHAPPQHIAARPILLGPDAPRRRPPVRRSSSRNLSRPRPRRAHPGHALTASSHCLYTAQPRLQLLRAVLVRADASFCQTRPCCSLPAHAVTSRATAGCSLRFKN